VETFAFAAEDDANRRRVVGFGVTFVAALVEPDEPVACFLQFFHRLREIGHLCDGQMRERACGSARDRVREPDCAALRNDDAMRACGEGRPNHGAEIVRIFDAVEKNDESFASVIGALVRGGENALERSRGAGGGQSDYSLMIFRIGETIELAALFKADGNVSRAGELDDFLDARVLAPTRDQDAVERAAGVESFAYGVDAG